MSNISVIDMVFFILIVLMVIHGYVKGFIEELFSWASLVLALGAAVMLYQKGAQFIRTKIMENVNYVPEILAFIAIFLLVMIFLKMLERVLKDVVEGAKLGGVNKILGAIFGLVEGFAITAIILFVLAAQPLFDASRVIGDSLFAQILLPIIKIPIDFSRDVLNTAALSPGLRPPRFLA